MNLVLWIIRYLATSLLSIIIFVSFLTFMLVSNFTGKLLDDSFYRSILQENDTYNRIYDEVLIDPGIRKYITGLPTGLQLVSHQEVVGLTREIAPPDYLQEQIETNIERTVGYFDGQRADLDIYIDLTTPLERITPNLFSYIDQHIDQIDIVSIDPNLSLPEQLAEVQRLSEAAMFDLGTGNPPRAVPAIEIIPIQYRADVFDQVLLTNLNDSRIDPRARQGVYDNLPAIREKFISGDTREFLKEAAHAGLTPMVEQSLARARQNLDEQERLDVIAALTKNNPDVSEQSVRTDLKNARAQVERIKLWGKTVALLVGITATIVLVLIYLPSVSRALRWPGLVLVFNGLMLLVTAKILEAMLPEQLTPAIRDSLTQSPSIPVSAVVLIGDLVQSFNEQILTGMATPAVILLIIGAVMFAASFLVVFLKPLAPGIR